MNTNKFLGKAASSNAQYALVSSEQLIENTGIDISVITVYLKDTKNAPLKNQKVELVSHRDTGDTISVISATTNNLGQALFQVTSTVTGTMVLTAYQVMGTERTIVGSLSLEVAEPQVSYSKSFITQNKTSIDSSGLDITTITVNMRSSHDTLLEGKQITLSSSRGSSDTITITNAVTNNLGQATFHVASTLIGSTVLTAQHVDTTTTNVVGKISVNVQEPQVSYYASSIASSKNTIENNNSDTSTITVTLKCANNTLVSGQTVSLVSHRSAGDTITVLNSVTDSAGQALFEVKSSDVGTIALTAYHINGNNAVIGSTTLNVVAPQVNYTTSNIVSTKSTIENTGSDISTITVTLKSATNTVLPGETVSLTSSRGSSDTITTVNAITDTSGQAIFHVSSTVLGSPLLSAKHVTNNNAIIGSLGITVSTPQPSYANSSVISSKSSIENTGADTSLITVTLRSSHNTFLVGETISVVSSRGSSDTITTLNAITNASGQASFSLSSHLLGSVILTAQHVNNSNAVIATVAVTVSDAQANYANSSVSSSKSSIENTGLDTSVITVTLRSSQNTVLSGQTVALVSSRGVSDTITVTNATTNASGQASFQVGSSTIGSSTLRAYHVNASNALIGSVTLSVVLPEVSIANSGITSSKSTIENTGSDISTVTVTLKSSQNTLIQGSSVNLVSNRGSSDTITVMNAVSNASGQAIFNVSSSLLGSMVLTAQQVANNNATIGTTSITVGTPQPSYANSSVISSKASIENTGAETSLITVTLRSPHNTFLAGETVSLTSSRGATDTLTILNAITNASGQASFTIASHLSGFVILTAQHVNNSNAVIGTVAITVHDAQPNYANSSITSSKNSIENTGLDTSTIKVTLRSNQNALLSGRTISLVSSRGSGDTITASNAVTDALGQAVFQLASTTLGSASLSVYDVNASNALIGTLSVTVADPQVSAANASIMSSKSAIENTNLDISTITVTLKSSQNTPIPGTTVSLVSSRGASDTIAAINAVSNASGQAIFQVSSNLLGNMVLTAQYSANATTNTIGTVGISVTTPQPSYPDSSVISSKSNIENTGVETSQITVTLKSSQHTVLVGETISLTSSRGASDTIMSLNAVTNALGQANFTIASSVSGLATLTAQQVSQSNAVIGRVDITVSDAQANYANATIARSKNSIENTGLDTSLITITIRSSQNTVLSGQTISLVSTRGSSDTITVSNAVTNALGQANFTIASTATGTSTLSAYHVNAANALVGTTSVMVAVPEISAANSVITSSKNTIQNTSLDTSVITVTLKSSQNTPIPGTTVSLFSSRGSSDTITISNAVSNALGQATFTFASNTTGLATVSAYDAANSASVIATLDIVVADSVGNYANASIVSSKSMIENTGLDSSFITVTLKDVNNAVLAGQTVSVTSQRGASDTITVLNAVTNGLGQATFQLVSSTNGVVTLKAYHTTVHNNVIASLNVSVADPQASAANSVITSSKSSVENTGLDTSTISVNLKSAHNTAVAGKTVTITSSQGALDTLTPLQATTDALGQATFSFASTATGISTLSAFITDTTNILMGTLNITVADPQLSAANSSITVSKSSIENTGLDQSVITVTLKSPNNTFIAGKNLSLGSSRGGLDGITPASAVTNASGQASFSVSSTAIGSAALTAYDVDSANAVIKTAVLNVNAPQVSAANSGITSSKNTIENTGTDLSTITVTLRSALNTLIVGKAVSLGSDRTSSDTVGIVNATTNAMGQASFTVGSSTVGTINLTAYDLDAGNAVLGSISLTVDVPQVSYTHSSISSTKNSIEDTGIDTAMITVIFRSENNTLISGKTVSLSSSRGGLDGITPVSAVTDASGQASFSLTSTAIGSATLTAYDVSANNAVIGSLSITVAAPQMSVANSMITASKSSIENTGADQSVITVTLKSPNNTLISGKTVSLDSSRGGLDEIAPVSTVTNASGQASFSVSSTAIGSATLTAYDVDAGNAVIKTVSLNVNLPQVSAGNSVIASSKNTLENTGADLSTITVTLKSSLNTLIAGKVISLVSDRGSSDNVTAISSTTNASGQASFTVGSVHVGAVNLTAYDVTDGNIVIGTMTLTVAVPQVSATNSVITSTKNSIENTGSDVSTVTVNLRSANNTLIQGKVVSLVSSRGSGDVISSINAVTDASGQSNFSFSSTAIGSAALTAYDVASSNAVIGSTSITVAAPQVSAASSTITASKSSIENTGTDQSIITVTLKSSNNTLIAGKTVSLSSSRGSADVITPASVVTDALGQASFSVSSTVVGTPLFTAYDNAANATIKSIALSVSLPQVSYTNSMLTGSKSTIENTGTDLSTITVTLRSSLNTFIVGKSLSLVSDRASGDTVVAISSTTNASGQASFTVGSTAVGTINLTAYDINANNAVIGTMALTVSLPQVSYTNSTITSSKSSIENTGTDATTLTVTLRSANNTTISGKAVSLASNRGSGDTIAIMGATTNASGQATFSLTSTSTGSATLTAYDASASSAVIGTTAITVTEPQAYYANSSITSSKSSIENTGVDTSLITVTLRSVTNTAVQGQTVTLASHRGSGDTITTLSGVTNASGQATFNINSTVVGTPILTAQHVNASNAVIGTLNLTVQLPQASYTNSTVTTTKSSIEASGVDMSSVTVTLLSVNNTPVTGQTISLTSSRSGSDTITAVSAVTNALGQATFHMTSNSVGSSTLTASHVSASNAVIGTLNITVVTPLVSPAITTASSIYYYSKGDSASIAANNSGGAIASCSISPSLPAGLSLSTSSSACQITGTVSTTYGMTKRHTITATNAAGSGTATFNLSIIANTHTMGAGFSCAYVSSLGSLKCWGYNNYSQLGDGTTTQSATPLLVSGFNNVIAVGAGIYNTCVILSDRTIKCWGFNGSGQLGNGTTTSSTTPVTVSGISNALYIAGGLYHHCALLQNGTIKCWGTNGSGQLGDGTSNNAYTPTTVSGITNAVALSVGREHTCAILSDTTARCWGKNSSGQLGDGTTTNRTSPVTVTGLSNITNLEAGQSATCAVLLDGSAACWGVSTALGNGSGSNSSTYVSVSNITNATSLAMGFSGNYACALLSDATVNCWGDNSSKSLADGTTTTRSTPVTTLLSNVQTLLAGGSFQVCVILNDSTMRCWGKNDRGQVGDGTTGVSSNPVTVLNIPP